MFVPLIAALKQGSQSQIKAHPIVICSAFADFFTRKHYVDLQIKVILFLGSIMLNDELTFILFLESIKAWQFCLALESMD